MRKRQAKRIACAMAATWIRGDTQQGAATVSWFTEEMALDDEDMCKVENALEAIACELERRGERWQT